MICAPDHLAVFLARDDFDEALGLIDRDRLADRAKRKLADLHLDSALARLRLGQPDRGDLGLAIDASGDRQQVEAGLAHAGHDLDRGDTLGGGLMREQGRTDHVADRVDARAGGAKGVVDLDETAAIEFDAEFFQTQVRAQRIAPDRDQHGFGLDGFRGAGGVQRDRPSARPCAPSICSRAPASP